MILVYAAMGRRLSWLVKKELDKPVLGRMIRWTGGIFVDRHHPNGTVGHVIDIINERDSILLTLAPSSTRSKTDRWRTGFYYMATGANVPVALGYLDYPAKEGGIDRVMTLSGDMEQDEVVFRAFYEPLKSKARYPENASDIRLIPHTSKQKAG
jgi:hypothetical protein